MKVSTRLAAIAGVICSALVIASVAWAAAAATKITFHGSTSGTVQGSIFSSSKSCLMGPNDNGRLVIAYQQKGKTQNPKVDTKEDTTHSSYETGQSHATWGMGQPGFPAHHKYYVKVTKTAGCKAGFSKSLYFK